MNLQQRINLFNKIVAQHGTKVISYGWDADHAYSMFNDLTNEVTDGIADMSNDDQDALEEHMNEWLYNNDDVPPCVPNGCCGCSVLNHIGPDELDELYEFKHRYSEEMSIESFFQFHKDVADRIHELELENEIDDTLAG